MKQLTVYPDYKQQDSCSHEKSGNVKIHFTGLEKSWILGKMAKVMKVMEFQF